MTVAVGVFFAIIHIVHAFEMRYYGQAEMIIEAIVPPRVRRHSRGTGPWLAQSGYRSVELRRIVGWMGVVAILVGLLFA